ncbi:hypothetical protein F2Q70_00037660 [Brassica cretica]|uniref:Uncharacterized protein n=2 Tax=Brassica cretica TaxID=69181 RepID=A0A8S9JSC5_BRACR|nr:hypothetical protein F2Q70_00037660 [Brassica cretica]
MSTGKQIALKKRDVGSEVMERVQPTAMIRERRQRMRLWTAVIGLRMRGPSEGSETMACRRRNVAERYNGDEEDGGAKRFTFGPRKVGNLGVVHEPVG